MAKQKGLGILDCKLQRLDSTSRDLYYPIGKVTCLPSGTGAPQMLLVPYALNKRRASRSPS